jgi:hypothetical protein
MKKAAVFRLVEYSDSAKLSVSLHKTCICVCRLSERFLPEKLLKVFIWFRNIFLLCHTNNSTFHCYVNASV